ncbi:MAG: ABC transporter ATP-binding protein [Phycisphaerales bacterium]|nr:ABC transporter ATP-binding protein [Phycisphaerales bacterium]
MITVDRVHKSFGTFQAVTDLSFSVPQGSICGFLGPNGAGKTTTIRMLAGAILPSSGRLTLAGRDVCGEGMMSRRQLGYLAESNPLPGELTVREYLKFRSELWGVPRSSRRAAIDGVIDRCGLREVRNKLLSALSRGFRQRAGLAAALVAAPAVLILDEPGSGLDPSTALAFRDLVRSLRGEHTLLFSSHNLAEVEATCDHLILIAQGRLVADGSTNDLRQLGAVAVRIEIESTRCDPRILQSIEGVLGVATRSLADGWIEVSVEIDGSSAQSARGAAVSALSTAIAESLSRSGAVIRRFERVNPSLEEVFQRLLRTRGAGVSQ